MNFKIIIAIDGYSSCGKSTLARALAQKVGYKYIDSGAMYRAVTLYALQEKIIDTELDKEALINSLKDVNIDFEVKADGRNEVVLAGNNVEWKIRTPSITEWVSPVAAISEVRTKLVAIQRKIAEEKGVVMDGRDIGTVVFPNAELKIFVNADLEIRANRRWQELLEKSIKVSLDDVKENLLRRDMIDSRRSDSPLRQAKDAILLDTSHLSREEQLEKVYSWFMEIRST